MIKAATKPKRGTAYMASGYPVWLYRIIKENLYLVCYDQKFALGADYAEVNPSNLLPVAKPRKPIGNKPKSLTADEKRVKAELNEFYQLATFDMPVACQECGSYLEVFNDWDARCQTAHILPKSENSGFPSIATNQANKLFLGSKNCNCHDLYDKRGAAYRSSMKVYPLILAAFEILKLELSEHDIIRAKKYLNIK